MAIILCREELRVKRKRKRKPEKKVKQQLPTTFDRPSPSLSNRATLDHSDPPNTTQE